MEGVDPQTAQNEDQNQHAITRDYPQQGGKHSRQQDAAKDQVALPHAIAPQSHQGLAQAGQGKD